MPDEQNDKEDAPEYKIIEEPVWKGLDPELQRVVIDRQTQPLDPLLHAEDLVARTEVVDVIAKLHNPNREVEGLHVVAEIGQIVTGTVDADKIEDVRRDPNVISLKGARRIRQALFNSVREINASPGQFQAAFPDWPRPIDGSNVIVGIIDHGCDFAHPNFRKPDGKTPGGGTRILYLWDQRDGMRGTLEEGRRKSPEPYGYGREFGSAAINEALTKAPQTPQDVEAPYRFLDYSFTSLHGTLVTDIAAGSGGEGKHAPGVAPGADIIFVDSSIEDLYTTGDSFGNSRRLLEAVKYVFDKARELGRPAVVNISLNYEAGPHDGSTLVEEGFDYLLETPGRAIVIAAGNSRLLNIHVRRAIHPRRMLTLRWQLRQNQENLNKLEVWYDGGRALSLSLCSPGDHRLGPFRLGSTHTIYREGQKAGYVFHRENDPTNGDNNVVLLFGPLMELGVWKLDLRLLDDGSRLPIEIHAWTERDRVRSDFPDALPTDNSCTLGTFGCGHSTIVVGAYNSLEADDKMGRSGEGPTRDGRLKPEVSAPGLNITTAEAKTASVHQPLGGTSLAAPHVTGLIALLMQAAAGPLHIEEIRKFVIDETRDEPPSPEHGWDTCYGAGRVDAVASLQALRKALAKPLTAAGRSPMETGEVISTAAGSVGEAVPLAAAGASFAASPRMEASGDSPDGAAPNAASAEGVITDDGAA